MTTEEKLKAILAPELLRKIARLERNVREARETRDQWKAKAIQYLRQLLEKR